MNSNDRIAMEMVLMASTPADVPQGVKGPARNEFDLTPEKEICVASS